MVKLNEPVEYLVEFIRSQITEPKRANYDNRQITVTETFDGDGSKTSFYVNNPKLLCINEVSISGVVQTKYVDYDIDLVNNRIIFSNAPADDTDNVSIKYGYGAYSWVQPKDPQREKKLNKSDYPRIAVTMLSSQGYYMGIGDTSTWETMLFQIDIVTKSDVMALDYTTINSSGTSATVEDKTMNRKLVEVIGRSIRTAIKRNITSTIGSKMIPTLNTLREETPIGFEEDKGIFRRVIVIQLQGKNLGENI